MGRKARTFYAEASDAEGRLSLTQHLDVFAQGADAESRLVRRGPDRLVVNVKDSPLAFELFYRKRDADSGVIEAIEVLEDGEILLEVLDLRISDVKLVQGLANASATSRFAPIERAFNSTEFREEGGPSTQDVLRGGGGNDAAVLGRGDRWVAGDGSDRIDIDDPRATLDYSQHRGGEGRTGIVVVGKVQEIFKNDGDVDSYTTSRPGAIAPVIVGTRDDDEFFGDGPLRVFYGGRGKDEAWGGSNDDRFFGEGGRDMLAGDGGFDRLHGGGGRDELFGGRDDDLLNGGGKADDLFGGGGDDRLEGKGGRDVLVAGKGGNDVLTGGGGGDLFVFHASGYAVATDFNSDKDDWAVQDFDGAIEVADAGADRVDVFVDGRRVGTLIDRDGSLPSEEAAEAAVTFDL